jgi:hypothetical protein
MGVFAELDQRFQAVEIRKEPASIGSLVRWSIRDELGELRSKRAIMLEAPRPDRRSASYSLEQGDRVLLVVENALGEVLQLRALGDGPGHLPPRLTM